MSGESSVFFPEPMDRITIVCPSESAYQCMRAINDFGYVQFDDFNSGSKSFQKRYGEPYMQAEEAERSLRFLKNILQTHELLPRAPSVEDVGGIENDADFNQIVEQINSTANDARERKRIFDDMKNEIQIREQKLASLRFFKEVTHRNNEATFSLEPESTGSSLLAPLSNENLFVTSITCFIPAEKSRHFVTTVYRLSRRNVIVNQGEVENGLIPFALFASSPSIMERVRKVAESYGSNVFEFQQDESIMDQTENELTSNLDQLKTVRNQTLEGNLQFLHDVAGNFWGWVTYIEREKLAFATMDFGNFQEADGSAIYKGWCPTRYVPKLRNVLDTTSRVSASPVPIHLNTFSVTKIGEDDEMPPTLIETNEFTYSFQCLNDAYGTPNYNELNGGAFYCTYPFLFGIMFGDMGHAFIYLLATIALFIVDPIIKRKKIDLGDLGGSLFSFKWLVLFASIFAFYCGFIYDEMFGLPVNLFGSHYSEGETVGSLIKYHKTDSGVYPFGIDPVWFFKDNELIFMNSYKMKLAIIVGMSQMIFGLFLGLINHIHRRDFVEIAVVWIPQFLYLVPFFGYLVVLIIKKWCTDFSTNPDEAKRKDGVNLIQVMISIILNFGAKDETLELYGNSQWTIQKAILYIFLLSIPMLLFLKPIYEIITKRGKPGFNLLEVFVMNLIEVIEFCLGALSHTASYLRLWALSLAHSQLSHVIYDELMVLTINMNNPVIVFVGFAVYVLMTIAILLGMEAFSALLHGIRLMWVEFSSKFYKGMGFEFKPSSTKAILTQVLA